MSHDFTDDDKTMLTGMAITAGRFDFALGPIIAREHSELLECFDITIQSLMPAKIADMILLRAKPALTGRIFSDFSFRPEDAIALDYGYPTPVYGDRCLFSSTTADSRRLFGVGTISAFVNFHGDEYEVIRSDAGKELDMGHANLVIYGRILAAARLQELLALPSVEALQRAIPGDVIEIEHLDGRTERRDVVRVSDRGTVYARRQGRKAVESLSVDTIRRCGFRVHIVVTAMGKSPSAQA